MELENPKYILLFCSCFVLERDETHSADLDITNSLDLHCSPQKLEEVHDMGQLASSSSSPRTPVSEDGASTDEDFVTTPSKPKKTKGMIPTKKKNIAKNTTVARETPTKSIGKEKDAPTDTDHKLINRPSKKESMN